jgi:hypothetical protein
MSILHSLLCRLRFYKVTEWKLDTSNPCRESATCVYDGAKVERIIHDWIMPDNRGVKVDLDQVHKDWLSNLISDREYYAAIHSAKNRITHCQRCDKLK